MTEKEIPSAVATAWGISGRAGKGPPPALSADRIIAAGIRVAEADGLAAVSMNRVAAELGTAAMSLYRHVASKDDMIQLMSDAAIGAPPRPRDQGEDWRTALSRWAEAILERSRRHPWLLSVPISGPPTLPNGVAWFECGLRSLAGLNLSEGEKALIVMNVNSQIGAQALMEAQLLAGMKAAGTDDPAAGYGALLSRLTDPVRFPALHALIDSGEMDGQPDDDDTFGFSFGLELMLDGIERFIDRRRQDG